MKKELFALVLPLALSIGACNREPGVQSEAKKTADVLSGDAAGSAASNPLCKLFTVDEIGGYEGAPVNVGANAAMGSGCQWTHRHGDGSAMVQVVAAEDFEAPSLAAGYKKLPGVGEKGFVAPQMGGWEAGAIQHDKTIIVLTGGTSTEAQTVMLLKEAMKRVGG